MKNRLLLAAIACMLNGCAHMNEDECTNADWTMVGYEDGAKGLLPSYISNYRKACAKYNITPNLTQYQKGHSQGIVEYCIPSRGYQLGQSGGHYNGVCPAKLKNGFLDGFDAGRQLYQARAAVNNLQTQIEQQYEELEALKLEQADREAHLLSPDATVVERKDDLMRIKEIQVEIPNLENSIYFNESELNRMLKNLEDITYQNQHLGY